MPERGEVRAVQWVQQGSDLDGDVSVGSLTLTVDSPVDFDEDGGTLQINDLRYGYSTVDLDTGIITLDDPLTIAASDNDRVLIISGGAIAVDYVAFVSLGDGDEVEVLIKYGDRDLWPEGEYDDPVVVDLSNDLEELLTVPGRTPARDGSFIAPGTLSIRGYQDQATAGAPGDLVMTLTYKPIGSSTVHVYWNGLEQPDAQWTLSGWQLTVLDTAHRMQVGDVIDVKYLYDDPAHAPVHIGSITYVSTATVPGGSSFGVRLVPIPVGVQVGDLFMFSLSANAPGYGATCTDSRVVLQDTANYPSGSGHGGMETVGYGVLTTLSDLTFDLWSAINLDSGDVSFYRVDGTLTPILSRGDTVTQTVFCFPTISAGDDNLSLLAVASNAAGTQVMQSPESGFWIGHGSQGRVWHSIDPASAMTPHFMTTSVSELDRWNALSLGVS